jgi:hypothetical protein
MDMKQTPEVWNDSLKRDDFDAKSQCVGLKKTSPQLPSQATNHYVSEIYVPADMWLLRFVCPGRKASSDLYLVN